MPASYPDFPHHTQIAAYFDDYVDHFGLRDRIPFETGVEHAARREDGAWDGRARGRRDARATTRCSSPTATTGTRAGPTAVPRRRRLHGRAAARPLLRRQLELRGQARRRPRHGQQRDGHRRGVLLRRRAHLPRRAPGRWIVPKYMFGKPVDQLRNDPRVPFKVRQRFIQRADLELAGPPERYGLPKPDHRFGEAHPTVSGRILDRITHGTITPSRTSTRSRARRCASSTAAREEADVVVYCTGYKITFPFFDEDFISAPDNHIELFRRVFHPDIPNVFFIGLLQPLGAIMPLAEAQGAWVADYLRASTRCRGGRDARGHRRRPRRDARALRGLQAPHDPGRLRRLPLRLARERRAGAGGRAANGYRRRRMPTFCRHNRFVERCPICSRTLPSGRRDERGRAGARSLGARQDRARRVRARTGRREGVRVVQARARTTATAAGSSRACGRRRTRGGWPRRSRSRRPAAAPAGGPAGAVRRGPRARRRAISSGRRGPVLIAYLSPARGRTVGASARRSRLPGPRGSRRSASGRGPRIPDLDGLRSVRVPRTIRRAARTLRAYGSGRSAPAPPSARAGPARSQVAPSSATLVEPRAPLRACSSASRSPALRGPPLRAPDPARGASGSTSCGPTRCTSAAPRPGADDPATLAAKRVFAIGDPRCSSAAPPRSRRRAAPLDALDLALANWGVEERATLGFRAASADEVRGTSPSRHLAREAAPGAGLTGESAVHTAAYSAWCS